MILKEDLHSAVLIATLGNQPQVVTAALDCLRKQGENIAQVHIIHTVDEEDTAIMDAVKTLRQALAQDHAVVAHFEPVCSKPNTPLADVDSEEAVQAVFRLLYRLINESKQAERRVHVSIAGGRKTMSVFGMVAAQLLFDEGDCLWHLFSDGDFLSSKRLYPENNDEVRLVQIPVIRWSQISPVFTGLGDIEDPYDALAHIRKLQLAEKLEKARVLVEEALTPAEKRAVELLVKEGLSDHKIANRLKLSSRTVEQQLRGVYKKAADHWELPVVGRSQLIALLNYYYTLSSQ